MNVTFDFSRKQIAIDGDELELVELLKLVREIAPNLPQITINAVEGKSPPPRETDYSGGGNGGSGGTSGGTQTLRQFARSIALNTASERIAGIAYYYKTVEKRDSFSPKEMSEWFTHCGFQKPSQMPVAVFDCKRKSGYLENAGHGRWKLSNSGENLIIGKLEDRTNGTE
jgi:hypothetical protein